MSLVSLGVCAGPPAVPCIHTHMRLARGAREDIALAIKRTSSRYSKWTRQDDKALLRVMEYLSATVTLGLNFSRAPR